MPELTLDGLKTGLECYAWQYDWLPGLSKPLMAMKPARGVLAAQPDQIGNIGVFAAFAVQSQRRDSVVGVDGAAGQHGIKFGPGHDVAAVIRQVEHDTQTGLFHISGILLDAHRQFLGQLYTVRKTQSHETNHAMAFDALEAGCVFARQLHMHKILARVPDEVHQAMSDLRNSNSDLPVDDDAGVDYLRTGRPPARRTPWRDLSHWTGSYGLCRAGPGIAGARLIKSRQCGMGPNVHEKGP